ncbi:hypothetical protein BD626DRAFT_511114 [Schizophyllum amplum]|uniref:Uncharacterized protein n=1 Tax=Schizophyllum amplum TaxID=97359 RepID=A0A550C0Z4_9AGAR|nr:hypothetical protein BD626DRAFT_511114 [Auriculariopsis ampla]
MVHSTPTRASARHRPSPHGMGRSSSGSTASPTPISPFSINSQPSEATSDETPDLGAFQSVFREFTHLHSVSQRLLRVQPPPSSSSPTDRTSTSLADDPEGSTVWARRPIAHYLESQATDTDTDLEIHTVEIMSGSSPAPSPPRSLTPDESSTEDATRSGPETAGVEEELEIQSDSEEDDEDETDDALSSSDDDSDAEGEEPPSLGYLDEVLSFLAAEKTRIASAPRPSRLDAGARESPRRRTRHRRRKNTLLAAALDTGEEADDSSSSAPATSSADPSSSSASKRAFRKRVMLLSGAMAPSAAAVGPPASLSSPLAPPSSKSTPATPARRRRLKGSARSTSQLRPSTGDATLNAGVGDGQSDVDTTIRDDIQHDRLLALATQLARVFPEDAARIAARPAVSAPGDPVVHVFIDHSNILIGLLNWLKRNRPARPRTDSELGSPKKRAVDINNNNNANSNTTSSLPSKGGLLPSAMPLNTPPAGGNPPTGTRPTRHLSHAALALILERGRPCRWRECVASSPLYQPMEPVAELGYRVTVFKRVPADEGGRARARGESPLTRRDESPVKHKRLETKRSSLNLEGKRYSLNMNSVNVDGEKGMKVRPRRHASVDRPGHGRFASTGHATLAHAGHATHATAHTTHTTHTAATHTTPAAISGRRKPTHGRRMSTGEAGTGGTMSGSARGIVNGTTSGHAKQASIHGSGVSTAHASGNNTPGGTRPRYREQGVDELLQLKVHQAMAEAEEAEAVRVEAEVERAEARAMVDMEAGEVGHVGNGASVGARTNVSSAVPSTFVNQSTSAIQSASAAQSSSARPPAPGTIILATGDGNAGEFNADGFTGSVRTALRRGWAVELVAWEDGLSGAWRAMFGKEERFRIVPLEPWAEWLWEEALW